MKIAGIVVAIAVSIYFVWSTLNTKEKTLEIEMCKIAMSGVQAVTVLGRYPLSWPSQVSSVLDAVGGVFSVAGDVVSFRCSMDPSDGSRYLRGSAVILASPLIACALAVLFWLVRSRQRNLPQKQVRANMIVTVMVLLFMALPSLNQATFHMFSCRGLRSGARVWRSRAVMLWHRSHCIHTPLGVPAICIYVVGIPAAAVLILRRMSRQVNYLSLVMSRTVQACDHFLTEVTRKKRTTGRVSSCFGRPCECWSCDHAGEQSHDTGSGGAVSPS